MKYIFSLFFSTVLLGCNQDNVSNKYTTSSSSDSIIVTNTENDYDSPKLDSIIEPMSIYDDSIMKKFIIEAQKATGFPEDNIPYISDDDRISNIERPKKSYIKNSKYPLRNLIGYWGGFKNEPVNDFAISSKMFDVADYDGDGSMPFILHGDSLIVFYNDFIRLGKIISSERDTIAIKWQDANAPIKYLRWN